MSYPKRLGLTAPWSELEASALRQFLGTVEGQRFCTKLFSLRPLATEKSDLAKRAIQSGVAEGFEKLYHEIEFLTTPQSCDRPKQQPDTL